MRLKLARWGNSLAIRIPSQLIEAMGLAEGEVLDVENEAGELHLKPAKLKPTLDELLAGITEENIHGEEDWGGSVGKEVW